MYRFAISRLLQAIPVLLMVITVTFFLVHSAPGGPFSADKAVPPEVIKALEEQQAIKIKKIEQLDLNYRLTLGKIDEKYNLKEEQLSRKNKKKVKEIARIAKEQPDEIDKKLENLFGFTNAN